MATLENTFFEYFNAVIRYLRTQPLNLGGVVSTSGGGGGPPGGFIGVLPQTKVAYDTSEAYTLATPGGISFSGASLLDNLNHIRYRLWYLENVSIVPGVVIQNNDVVVGSGITVLNLAEGLTSEYDSPGKVNISLSLVPVSKTVPSGVFGEDLTSQIGASATHFDISKEVMDSAIALYYNGVRQSPGNYTLDGDHLGVTTSFTVYSGSTLVIDYETPVYDYIYINSGITESYLSANYYNQSTIDAFLAGKANSIHSHVEADITDLSFNALEIRGVPVSTTAPQDGEALIYNSSLDQYVPDDTNATGKVINQQYLFSVDGTLSDVGTILIPFTIYAHDVNGNATIDEVFVSLYTAPTTTPVKVVVLKNNNTIFNIPSYIEIPVGDTTVTRNTSFASDTFTKNDKFQIQLLDVDSGASYLTVHLRFHWTTNP